MKPSISAVLITHNRLALLQRAVSGALSQTIPVELIVVDDCSSDGTRQWLETFAPAHNITCIFNPETLGGNHCRNLGIRAASADFIALLDDDDEWLPDKLEKQLALLQSDPSCGVVSCARIAVYDSGRVEYEDPSILPEGDLSQAIFTDLHFTSSRLLCRKSLLLEAGLFDESLRAWQDYELMIRLSALTRFGVVRENLVRYHISSSDPARVSNQVEAWESAVRYIHRKHASRLAALPPSVRRAHRLMVLRDGANRSDRANRPGSKRKYLLKTFFLQPTPENLKKALLNQLILTKPPLITRVFDKLSRLIHQRS